jgi:hypothetical protein
MTTVTGHCLCGSSYRITSAPQIAHGAARLWWQVHTGCGHGPATPDQCRAARIATHRHENTPCQTDDSSAKP